MRTYPDTFIQRTAHRIQARAFYAGVFAGLAFIGFALADVIRMASACALVLVFALGVSVGAWWVGNRFR